VVADHEATSSLNAKPGSHQGVVQVRPLPGDHASYRIRRGMPKTLGRLPLPPLAESGTAQPRPYHGRVTLRLHDTATRDVRDFVPLEAGKAGIYVCGLTVQSEPHVGHVRSAVNFDVLRRWLTATGYDVTFIRNVTDIDDKILAKGETQGRPWFEIAYRMSRELDKALDAINVLPPTYEPAATGHVPEILELIGQLVARGHAYPAEDGSGDVYFDVRSWPAYGELTRQKVDDMEPAEDADPRGKRDPRDFALWKGWKKALEPETAAWPSPYGPGRPGWHIECSAMAAKYLGPAFDIHGGGVDLRFPHHENEMAQSRAAGQRFASYWLHNAWITTAGEKMSKSLGNSLLIPEVLKRVRGIELRYYMVAAHYRSHVEFSFEALDDAAAAFRRIESFVGRARQVADPEGASNDVEQAVWDEFAAAMDDDLGTPAAVGVIHNAVRRGNKLLADGDAEPVAATLNVVVRMLDVLGLDPADPAWGVLGGADDAQLSAAVDALVAGLLEERAAARADKDWARADAIRDRIAAAGIAVEDTPDGPKWTLAEGS
jgi:cysteinyl-tRNA synthetase